MNKTKKPIVEIQLATQEKCIPRNKNFKDWVFITLNRVPKKIESRLEVIIRIVDAAEITDLNNKYRHKNKPTNVLSFTFEPISDIDPVPLGDIVICAPVTNAEAKEQNIPWLAHWAHLTIHGVLHLLGYDHDNDTDAEQMELLEYDLLQELKMI